MSIEDIFCVLLCIQTFYEHYTKDKFCSLTSCKRHFKTNCMVVMYRVSLVYYMCKIIFAVQYLITLW